MIMRYSFIMVSMFVDPGFTATDSEGKPCNKSYKKNYSTAE